MVGHLKACLAAPARPSGAAHPDILLLRAQANHIPPFWLYVAVRSDARLKDLDRFLRRIWLECCGHMSEFSGPSHQKISMNTPVGEAAGLAGHLEYVYDFGSSTELAINLTGAVCVHGGRARVRAHGPRRVLADGSAVAGRSHFVEPVGLLYPEDQRSGARRCR